MLDQLKHKKLYVFLLFQQIQTFSVPAPTAIEERIS